MPHVKVSREVLEAVLACYLATGSKDDPEARAGAQRHRVLPLFNDFVGCWALDMTGRLVFFPWMRLKSSRQLSADPVDATGAHAALAYGSVRFPALEMIRPVRRADALPCTSCDGTGRLSGVSDNLVCACGELAWLPPSSHGAT